MVLYAAKVAMYPGKVHKELMHNVSGALAVVPFITLVLFAYLERDRGQGDRVFAKVGAVGHAAQPLRGARSPPVLVARLAGRQARASTASGEVARRVCAVRARAGSSSPAQSMGVVRVKVKALTWTPPVRTRLRGRRLCQCVYPLP